MKKQILKAFLVLAVVGSASSAMATAHNQWNCDDRRRQYLHTVRESCYLRHFGCNIVLRRFCTSEWHQGVWYLRRCRYHRYF